MPPTSLNNEEAFGKARVRPSWQDAVLSLTGALGRCVLGPLLFQWFYAAVDNFSIANVAAPASDASDEIVSRLRSDGMVRWKGFLSGDEVRHYSNLVTDHADRAKQAFEGQPDHVVIIDRPQDGCRFQRSDWFEEDGRDRALIQEKNGFPLWVRDLIREKKLAEVVSRFVGKRAHLLSVLLERYRPARDAKHEWHFDTIGDELRLMILLSETPVAGGGAMRYKKGSHKTDRRLLPQFHLAFKYGRRFQAPSGFLVSELKTETLKGSGSAGDGILFVTRGIHATSPLDAAERLTIVFTFKAPTLRNRLLALLGARLI